MDSSELAFKLATVYAFREAFKKSKPVILEPIMDVEITVPIEFQGTSQSLQSSDNQRCVRNGDG